ncbi:MAG: ABC transporter permease [Thermoanaerobaculia bacterium]|nr:ABC transporter permease [Thermoanaerobaculia bacterium]
MDTLLRDVRFALRGLAKRPGFTFVAILSLALGIGANGTVFSLVHGMLFRPLPGVQAGDELARIYSQSKSFQFPLGVSALNYEDIAEATDEIFVSVGAQMPVGLGVSLEGEPAKMSFGLAVYGDYFETLGTRPAEGRLITGSDVASHERIVVVSYDFWKTRLGGDPNAVGEALDLNGSAFMVAGVAEKGFSGTEVLILPDFWVPLTAAESLIAPGLLEERGSRALRMTARLAPGVESATAGAALETISTHLIREYPEENRGESHRLMPENDARIEAGLGEASRMFGFLLLALVGGVLLIACANVANLILARADGRRKELAVQVALGAGRGRLVRHHLVDSLVLAGLGGLTGVALAIPLAQLIANYKVPSSLPVRILADPDLSVVGFMAVVTLVAGVVFGILPAWRAARTHPSGALRSLPETPAGRFGKVRLGSLLVVGQVAVSLVLLIAAGLFLRSLEHAGEIDLGFDVDNIASVTFDVTTAGYDEEQGKSFLETVEQRLAELPGVEELAIASPIPMDWMADGVNLGVGRDLGGDAGDEMLLLTSWVGPGYFETLGTPILEGRPFVATDDTEHPRVIIVNQALAKTVWPDDSPIGKTLRIGGRNGEAAEVVGLVPTGKYRLPGEAPRPYAFIPLAQDFRTRLTVAMKTRRPMAGLIEQAKAEVLALDSNLAIEEARPFAETVESRVLGPLNLVAALAGSFGLIGLVLAAIGLYGVMALQVVHRTREIGIRMALGAGVRRVLGEVVKRGLSLACFGLVLGTGLGMLATRVMGSFLLGVGPRDPLTFATVILLLAVVAILASLVPAIRATLIDPVRTLRAE